MIWPARWLKTIGLTDLFVYVNSASRKQSVTTNHHNSSQPESNTETNILPILSLIPVKVDRRSLSVFVSPEKSNLKDHPRQNEFFRIYGGVLLPFLEEKTKFQLRFRYCIFILYIIIRILTHAAIKSSSTMYPHISQKFKSLWPSCEN